MSAVRPGRAVSAALLVVLALSWSVRGHCPMSSGASDAAEAAHDCCGALRVSSPASSCCHADVESDPPATREAARNAPALSVVARDLAPVPATPSLPAHRTEQRPVHGPPPAILRV